MRNLIGKRFMEQTYGYIYVMMNASYNGLVKIGKTTKDPQERAKELSSATGVATPFIVVFKKEFKNCHVAEKFIHSILEEQGYRVNASREFFSIDITEAINLIMSIPDENNSDTIVDTVEDNSSEDNLAEFFYDTANDYYLGTDDVFQDEDLALEYFEKSASLGKVEAYIKMGDIRNKQGKTRLAYDSYKIGLDNGCNICYGKLGQIFSDKDSSFFNKRNAELAYKKFFEYIDNNNEIQVDIDFAWKNMDIGFIVDHFILIGIINDDIPLELNSFLIKYAPQIKTHFDEILRLSYEINPKTAQFYESKMRPYIDNLLEKRSIQGLEGIELAKKYFSLAKESFKLVEKFDDLSNYYDSEQRTLDLFTKSVELGCQLSNVYIGICWLYKRGDLSIFNADKAWKTFYNYAYHTLTAKHESMTKEQKEELCYGFTLLIIYAMKFDVEKLIHEYYVQIALHLGIIDYYTQRTDNLSKQYCNLEENLDSKSTDLYNIYLDYSELEIEKNMLEKVHSFVKKYMVKFIEKNGEYAKFKIYPLDTEFCKYRI